MASASRIHTHTRAEALEIARKAQRNPAAVTLAEWRALGLFVMVCSDDAS